MDNVIILPTKTMQKKLLGIDYVSSISVQMKDASKSEDTKADLQEIIRENHNITDPTKDDFQISTMAEAAETIGNVASGITLLLVALVCISLIVGGVGIMNIMYVSVAERTFEIGLRKSLGAKNKDVLWQFLIEALLITIGGGVFGVIFGIVIAFLIYVVADWVSLQVIPSDRQGMRVATSLVSVCTTTKATFRQDMSGLSPKHVILSL
jgi:putative ABC transport system permease protein